MSHAIIRGKNGRRHEVDFGGSPLRVEIFANEESVEIFVEADFETHPEERRRFALINHTPSLVQRNSRPGGITSRDEGSMMPWLRTAKWVGTVACVSGALMAAFNLA
jgi:hypothetical protein